MEAARERWPNERRSSGPYQRLLRNDLAFFGDIGFVTAARQSIEKKCVKGSIVGVASLERQTLTAISTEIFAGIVLYHSSPDEP
jgi:hypothetical protein